VLRENRTCRTCLEDATRTLATFRPSHVSRSIVFGRSVPVFSDSLARWRYGRVAVLKAFERGQHEVGSLSQVNLTTKLRQSYDKS